MSDFEAIVAGLELDEIEVPDTFDVKALSFFELSKEHSRVRRELMDLDELLHPKTQRGRDLHSQRVALVTEIRTRKT